MHPRRHRLPVRPPSLDHAAVHGPLPSWPAAVDRGLEAWARCPPRLRVALRAAVLVLVVLATSGGLLRGPWGRAVPVVVAGTDVAVGAAIADAAPQLARWPAELVPVDAVRSLDELDPADRVATSLLAASVVTRRHLAPGPDDGGDPGSALVAVPAELLAPVSPGTHLDLVVVGHDGAARTVASDAVVVADDGTWRWLRVDRAEVADVAVGISAGTLVAGVLPRARSGAP